ncbi:hypothetical protein CA600_21805 [Paenibacillus sp. VTT E-133280]|uniref:hypothetical protein n=1 Tax=Paenibacillus sp. VTT E-133280 TaxID=1986222 RepID=UPI000BA10AA8|nr:hypothetical protein [Paenibacillus sp. VTT E-133280]OZQ62540.1 hypothetical protein CA600_21805 [Paenibacillus sp. VTT E-133280]
MRLLVAQPNHEPHLEQLLKELKEPDSFDAMLYPEGYVADEASVRTLCELAKTYNKLIITGYRNSNNKDRALIIHPSGDIILERAKSPMDKQLYHPSIVETEGLRFGYLLCVELLQGYVGLEGQAESLDFIAHPIGVGMFSEEQFALWIEEATRIAVKYNTMIMGTSHADGSYRNCGISIPISYWIDATGEPIYISSNDTRSRIINLKTRQVDILNLGSG